MKFCCGNNDYSTEVSKVEKLTMIIMFNISVLLELKKNVLVIA